MPLIHSSTKLRLVVNDNLIPRFFLLLQKGFKAKALVGCSIKSLLCDQFGVSPDYLEESIQTIFLNGKPIDDINSTIVNSGSTLALSAALPGLAGATLRMGSYYAPLRSQISYKQSNDIESTHEGVVFLKLFNLSLKELGPLFLSQGVLVDGKSLSNFFRIQPRDFWEDCQVAEMDGQKITPKKLREMTWQEQYVFSRVSTS